MHKYVGYPTGIAAKMILELRYNATCQLKLYVILLVGKIQQNRIALTMNEDFFKPNLLSEELKEYLNSEVIVSSAFQLASYMSSHYKVVNFNIMFDKKNYNNFVLSSQLQYLEGY